MIGNMLGRLSTRQLQCLLVTLCCFQDVTCGELQVDVALSGRLERPLREPLF
jgi:hypothetical protein